MGGCPHHKREKDSSSVSIFFARMQGSDAPICRLSIVLPPPQAFYFSKPTSISSRELGEREARLGTSSSSSSSSALVSCLGEKCTSRNEERGKERQTSVFFFLFLFLRTQDERDGGKGEEQKIALVPDLLFCLLLRPTPFPLSFPLSGLPTHRLRQADRRRRRPYLRRPLYMPPHLPPLILSCSTCFSQLDSGPAKNRGGRDATLLHT